MRSRVRYVLAASLAGSTLLALAPAQAGYHQPGVVSDEADVSAAQLVATAAVPRPRVDALADTGAKVYLGGHFRRVEQQGTQYRRQNLAAVDKATGEVHDLSLRPNGKVLALAAHGRFLYVGGDFTHVSGRSKPFLVKVNRHNGTIIGRFKPRLNGAVRDLQVADGMLFVGGAFGKRLVALRLGNGSNTGYVDLKIRGKVPPTTDRTAVNRFEIDRAGTRLVAVGNFTSVSGNNRKRAFLANLNQRRARLASWYYAPLRKPCQARNHHKAPYVTDVDFSPDGSYFVLVSTGYIPRPGEVGETICDAAARFDTDIASPDLPKWINYTGGDTLWSVTATGAAVYVQGHNRWLDNPDGADSMGDGAVIRRGIGAIDPVTGKALAWNPLKPAKRGGRAFLATADGLWVGSDSPKVGGQPRRGLAYFPLAE